ncbi:hypothetical protein GTY80_09465 [Amycolatopsis sp. SID8362]|nr:hypothetical protein [Amycolatopsis sp. SID8362]
MLVALVVAGFGVGIGALPAVAVPRNDRGVADDGAVYGDHDQQHGGAGGHLPATKKNVQLVGKVGVHDRGQGRVADVGVLGNFAYEAAFSSPTCVNGGVYVFDIKNLSQPKEIGFIPTAAGSFVGEGIQAEHVKLASGFRGDLLLFNNEICDATQPAPVGGATLVDVSDPYHPRVLASGFGDVDDPAAPAHAVHSAFMWDAGNGKEYAVLVDDDESADVDIFDITDPAHPVKVAEHDLAALFPQILQPNAGLDTVFFHDVVVRKVGNRQIMLASYWDAGYVKLDVTDPAHPVYVADSDFTNPDPELLAQTGTRLSPEGNGHEAEFTKDNRYIIGADEDFGPTRILGSTDDGTSFSGAQGGQAQLGADKSLAGTTVYVGRACTADGAIPPPPATGGPYIAVVQRGTCTFNEKQANVEAVTANGGYAGTIVFNREGDGGCGAFGMTVDATKPIISVDRKTGYSFFDAESQYDPAACAAGPADGSAPVPFALGAVGDKVTVTAKFDGWGYVHLYKNGTGKLQELDTYAIPEAMDPGHAAGFGALSVHEVATSHCDPSLAYFSYYAGGFRVTKIKDNKLVEVGRFIDEGGNDFWGVQVFQRDGVEYVAASDRDFGLYIFRYTGP